MGVFDWLRWGRKKQEHVSPVSAQRINIVGADAEMEGEPTSSTFEDKNITYNGSLENYNWQQ